ncbi:MULTISPECIES: polysaccharide biosynthesis tyrosine autokinase [Gemella]|uniref:polysaccharide biosynthesis tyrosine autokinase n=1 Tax=Gemella TaxID=1378 RepID=UPI00076839EA|nr:MULTISPECIES: polysaccharide biosynthesis tyrosine autokinase [Gemella]AME08873.1 tyrosine protein kinase [Gemella sp. oral taxon 928]
MAEISVLNNEKIVDSSIKEYYNALRTNVQFLGKDIKVIAITSTSENEGKSTVSINLAISLAELGLKTVLIDADTRKSVMAGRFKFKNKINGLTNYLSGVSPIEDIIYETDVNNLNIIPAGQVPPNPTGLLQNRNFNVMIDVFKEYYDYIIIDTPPIGAVVDAAIISQKCDGFAIVVESNKIKKKVLEKSKEQLEKAGSKFLGVILNKVDVKEVTYGGYGAYGGYGEYGKEN